MAPKFYNFFILTALVCILYMPAAAQQTGKPVFTPIKKFKPPVVKTYLAKLSGSNAHSTAEEAKQIIVLPLRVSDDKNILYKISSYQLAYKRLGVTEDEETGKVTPSTDMVGQRFTETPLPAIWKTNVTETLKKGEELYFFDVIVSDKQGRLFFAPDLKIKIE